MSSSTSSFSAIWTKLIGDTENFSLENRAFNSICIISLIVLLILLPFNIYIGLTSVCILMSAVILIGFVLYYLSRVEKKYRLSMNWYATVSYLLLILNYFYNSGSKGPSLLLFCLTFQMLIAFTPNRQHIIWVITHLLSTSALLLTEYFYTEKIPFTYASRHDQYVDLWTSTIVVLSCMYCITIYLRSNYLREKKLTTEHARKIEEQNQQILSQVEQLRELNQQKSKVLSVLSSDLKNPLNSITSVLEMLTSYPIPEERRKELKSSLLHTTRNTSDLVANLFAWSSLQMNRLEPHNEKVNVAGVLTAVCQSQRIFADAKAITIRLIPAKDIFVFADRSMLELSIRNILNNAVKFTAEGGVIEVIARIENEDCIISIRDNGAGMSEEQIKWVFGLDIHATFGSNNEKGMGLGLVLCKEFAEMHEGRVWASSELRRGSVFHLSLPAFYEEAEA